MPRGLATACRGQGGTNGAYCATPRGRGHHWGTNRGCRLRRVLLGFLVAGFVLATVSCSDASKPAAQSSTSSASGLTSAASTSSSVDPRVQAQTDLDAYWAMVKRLNGAPDPADPEIAQRAVDPSLSAIRDLLTTRRAQGLVERYDGVPYHVDTSVTDVASGRASFVGCIVDGALLVNAATGEVVNDKVSTSRIAGDLTLDAGTWKMQRFDVLKKSDGEVSCDALS